MTLSLTTKERVEQKAKEDAALFVSEFAEPLDPTETDWDGIAWTDSARELRLTDLEHSDYWPVYQAALVAETERLTANTETESAVCIYCHSEVDHPNDVPVVDDDERWAEFAKEHGLDCEWVATRAHQLGPEEVGEKIGRAMARDVLAEDMPREWTGLDAQDADQIPDGMDHGKVELAARMAYEDAISRAKS